ncbi:MAG: hypothetical protein HQL94_09130 [Magnetococcales bacterium]|nr:hypothetical protein [Magnetococcales bacterium]
MGIHVNLYIFSERIDPNEWRMVYLETLQLLQAWPGGILGFREEQVDGTNRLSYSSNFEHAADDWKKRHWWVDGDQESGQFGESFRLYADLYVYRRPKKKIKQDKGGMLAQLRSISDAQGTVFDSKTQGHPYHYAMLAVAMLIEDRFPHAALAAGDITLPQSRKARQTICELLGRDVALPILVEGARLLQECFKQFGQEEGLQEFFYAFHGDERDHVAAIELAAQAVEPSVLRRCHAIRMSQFPDPNTLGFRGLCQDWMRATGDLASLIDIACLDKDGPRVRPIELANALVAIWLTVPPDAITSLPRPEENPIELPTINDLFCDVMFRLSGLRGLNTYVYVDINTFLDVFQFHFPNQIENIRREVIVMQDKILTDVVKMNEKYAKLIQEECKNQEIDQGISFGLDDLRHIHPSTPLHEETANLLDGWAKGLQTSMQHLYSIFPEIAFQNIDDLRTSIYDVTYGRYLVLTEREWGWIDRETDRKILLVVLMLLAIDDNSDLFVNTRKVLLESPFALSAVCERMTDFKWNG